MALRAADGALIDDIVIPQGARWNRIWNITDDNNQPLDVTGWSVRAQVRSSVLSSVVLYEWNSAGGVGLGSAHATGSTVRIELDGPESDPWTWRVGRFDVKLTDPSGMRKRIVQGIATVDPAITH